DEAYKLVRAINGVTGFVQSGSRPIPLDDVEVRRIVEDLEKSGQEAPKVNWNKGDKIRVVEGPFSEFAGQIEEVNADREKLRVLINIFGRDTPVELDFQQVERMN
ncbi:MAG: transcription termination/antitermination protein NusG, partial [Armatimonadota bacterium]